MKTMGDKTWGNSQTLINPIQVDIGAETPKGQYCYVVNAQTKAAEPIPSSAWTEMMNGDMSIIQKQIEKQIQGSQVIYIRIHWDSALLVAPIPEAAFYIVTGFRVEALVKNVSASQTGLEIVAIILAVAFLVAVLAVVTMGSWIAFQVVKAAGAVGPVGTVVVGLIVLAGAGFLLYFLFGGGAKVKTKRGTLQLRGRGR